MKHYIPLLLLVLACMAVEAAHAQRLEGSLHCSDPQAFDAFGNASAVDGDVAMIGAPGADEGASNAGAVYVFARSTGGWEQVQKLTASDPQAGAQFGFRIALAGDEAIVSAFGADAEAGKVYVFERTGSTWSETGQLVASDTDPHDWFGRALDLDGDQLIVGAPLAAPAGMGSGAAYVFGRTPTGWVQVQRLQAFDGQPLDTFGRSVGIEGDAIVVGAWGCDDHGSNSGAAYVFRRQGSAWTRAEKLYASDPSTEANFGISCALSATTIVVGAYRAGSVGAVYAFERGAAGYFESGKIQAPDGAAGDKFGAFLDLEGDTLVVAAREDDDGEANSGSAYLFRRFGRQWFGAAKLGSDPGAYFALFGNSVALSGRTLIVGAPGAAAHTNTPGSAYSIELARVLGRSFCPSQPNSTGLRARLAVEGFSAVSAGYLRLTTHAVPSGHAARYVACLEQDVQPPAAQLGTGLCLSGPLQLASGVLTASPGGIVTHATDLWTLAGGDAVLPGQTWSFQLWFQDGSAPWSTTTSDAVAVTFEPQGAAAFR